MGQIANIFGRSRIPLYLQMATTLRRRIETGRWEAGEKFPTLEELRVEFQVARVTVRQALDLLEAEGLVHRYQGKGTFVAEGLKDKRWLKLDVEWSSLIDTIKDNVPTFVHVNAPPSQPRLDPGDGQAASEYQYLCSVQSSNNEPYAFASVHIARQVYEQSPETFRSKTALPILATLDRVTIARAHQTLVIGSADTEPARYLEVPLNSPTAEVHCVVVDEHGIAIYVGEIVYRGDCVKLDIDLLQNNLP